MHLIALVPLAAIPATIFVFTALGRLLLNFTADDPPAWWKAPLWMALVLPLLGGGIGMVLVLGYLAATWSGL